MGRLEHLEDEFVQYCTYQRGCNKALAQMMQALALHIGIEMDSFLTLPVDPFNIAHQEAGSLAGEDIEEEDDWSTFQLDERE